MEKTCVVMTAKADRMGVAEFMDAVRDRVLCDSGTTISRGQVRAVVKALAEVIGEKLLDREAVPVPGLGIFSARFRSGHKARNPHTGESMMTEAYFAPAFRAAKALRQKVRER